MVRVAILLRGRGQDLGLGDGVVAAAGEGMAAGDAAEGEPASAQPAVADDGDVGVLAAGGEVLALGDGEDMEQGREAALVEGEQGGGDAFAASGRLGHGGWGRLQGWSGGRGGARGLGCRVVGGLDAAEDGGDFALELGEVEVDDGAAGVEDDVDGRGEEGEGGADGFAQATLDAVAIDGLAEGFGDGEADARAGGGGARRSVGPAGRGAWK